MAILKESFFEKNEKKIKKIIKDPLLELVLKYLPHLQLTTKEKEDAWEAVAIELNGKMIELSLDPDGDNEESLKTEELPVLNGRFVKDVYEKIYKNWEREFRLAVSGVEGEKYVKYSFNRDRSYFLCQELYNIRNFDIEEIARASCDKLSKTIRKRVLGDSWVEEHNPPNDTNGSSDPLMQEAQSIVEEARKTQEASLAERLHEELAKRDKKIETLRRENSKLIELNQDLLSGNSFSR